MHLELIKRPLSDPKSFQKLYLACEFTSLHLKTFLAAQLRLRLPESRFEITSVLPIADASRAYEISPNSKDICGPFSGLSFGPANTTNDHVLAVSNDHQTVRQLIRIDGRPNMVSVRRDKTEILFLSSDVVDVNDEMHPDPISNYFSRLMPHALALRRIFGEERWQPCRPYASIIIDDPLLRQDYVSKFQILAPSDGSAQFSYDYLVYPSQL